MNSSMCLSPFFKANEYLRIRCCRHKWVLLAPKTCKYENKTRFSLFKIVHGYSTGLKGDLCYD